MINFSIKLQIQFQHGVRVSFFHMSDFTCCTPLTEQWGNTPTYWQKVSYRPLCENEWMKCIVLSVQHLFNLDVIENINTFTPSLRNPYLQCFHCFILTPVTHIGWELHPAAFPPGKGCALLPWPINTRRTTHLHWKVGWVNLSQVTTK